MLSIIIPVYNEKPYFSKHLEHLLQSLQQDPSVTEILFVDGGSKDDTVAMLQKYGCSVIHSPKGRAIQMNIGAKNARGDVLFFLFCDCLPEQGFGSAINEALQEKKAGCLSFCYDSDCLNLKLFSCLYGNSFFLRHKFGDSGIFVKKDIFLQQGLFNEINILEHDNQFINEMLDLRQFQQISCKIFVSPRIYDTHGFIKVILVYMMIHLLYHFGISQQKLIKIYKTFLS